jgi:sigma-E factor negative regulatory protein RseC
MLSETGRVVAVEADALWVETIRLSTCGSCAARKGCGHALLDRGAAGRRGRIRILPGRLAISQFRIDDLVLIAIPDEIILRGSLIAYGLPLLGMLAGAFAAVSVLPASTDLAAVPGAIAGLLLGYALVRRHGLRHSRDPAFQPVLQGLAPSLVQAVTLR